jgi:hypothetical protein
VVKEKNLVKLARIESKGRNVMIRGTLERSGIWDKLARLGHNGVRVTIKGKAGNKARRQVIDIILDSEKLKDVDQIKRTVLAKILFHLGKHELRLSDAQIAKKSHKKYSQLENVKFGIETFGGDEPGEDQEWDEEDGEGSISEPKTKKKRNGKRKRSRRLKSSRSTRKTTRKGKSRS